MVVPNLKQNQLNKDRGNLKGKPNLKLLIRKYLSTDTIITKEIKDPRYEFGFHIIFPNVMNEKGEQKGKPLVVLKPKKKNFVEIVFTAGLGENYRELIRYLSEDEKASLEYELSKFAISQNLFQNINLEEYSIVVKEKVYLHESSPLSVNKFYRALKKVLNVQLLLGNFLEMRFMNISSDNDSITGY
ncbi:MAG: DUF2299 family protein [Candidatus Hermodarchaeota archaeon]